MKQDMNGVRTAQDLEIKYDLAGIETLKENYNSQNQAIKEVDNELKDFVSSVTESIGELQDQVDGNITTWFYSGVPNLSNYPASEWTTDEDKNNHLGDLYYDKDTGYAYRFSLDGTTYSWIKLTDSDVTEALAIANAAQDTADSKRRVFLEQPVPPYDNGDMWINNNEIYICQISKSTGQSFADADFINNLKYTDDTVANQVGENLTVLSGTVLEIRNDVDEQSTTITQTVALVNEQGEKIGILEENTSEVQQTANELSVSIEALNEATEQLNITLNGIENNMTKIGGGNLIKDSLGALNDGDWTNQVSTIRDTYTLENSIAGQGIMLNNNTIEQQIQLPNEIHTLSFKYKKNLSTANVKLYLNDVEYVLVQTETTEFSQQITISNNTLNIKFTSDTDNSCYILDLLLNLGSTKDTWTQNANETVTNTVKIGQGIQVEDSKYNTYWRADSDGTRIVNKVTGDYVQETTDKAVIANELTSRSTSIINGVLFTKLGTHRWISGV